MKKNNKSMKKNNNKSMKKVISKSRKSKINSKSGGSILKTVTDTVNKLVVPLGLALAARYLSKKKKSKKQKGGFIRAGSDQFFYNGSKCNANKVK